MQITHCPAVVISGLGLSRGQKKNCRLLGREGFGDVVWLGPLGRFWASFFGRHELVVLQPWWMPWQLGSCDGALSARGAQEIWLRWDVSWLPGCAGSWRGYCGFHRSLGSLAARCSAQEAERGVAAWAQKDAGQDFCAWLLGSDAGPRCERHRGSVSRFPRRGTERCLPGRAKLASVLCFSNEIHGPLQGSLGVQWDLLWAQGSQLSSMIADLGFYWWWARFSLVRWSFTSSQPSGRAAGLGWQPPPGRPSTTFWGMSLKVGMD